MAGLEKNKDEQRKRFGSGPRKTTVYKNGKLVKDEATTVENKVKEVKKSTKKAEVAVKAKKPAKKDAMKSSPRPAPNPNNTKPSVDSSPPTQSAGPSGDRLVVKPARAKDSVGRKDYKRKTLTPGSGVKKLSEAFKALVKPRRERKR